MNVRALFSVTSTQTTTAPVQYPTWPRYRPHSATDASSVSSLLQEAALDNGCRFHKLPAYLSSRLTLLFLLEGE